MTQSLEHRGKQLGSEIYQRLKKERRRKDNGRKVEGTASRLRVRERAYTKTEIQIKIRLEEEAESRQILVLKISILLRRKLIIESTTI